MDRNLICLSYFLLNMNTMYIGRDEIWAKGQIYVIAYFQKCALINFRNATST